MESLFELLRDEARVKNTRANLGSLFPPFALSCYS